jgi:hypothetical protein
MNRILLTLPSPFLTEIRVLYFAGPTKYHVHSGLLTEFEQANTLRRYPGSTDINLEEVPKSAGIVLVNYLYSGLCQLGEHTEDQPLAPYTLNTSLQVYIFSRRYHVDGLEQLVTDQITQSTNEHQPSTILEAVRRNCDPFPKDETWLRDLVRGQCHSLLRHPDQFNQDSIQQLIPTNDTVSRILLQELLSRRA